MALIASISGVRGTIGGKPGENFTPLDIVKFTSAYGFQIRKKFGKGKIVVGRDGRVSGPIVSQLVTSTLSAIGLDVLDLGLSTTPTVEMAVTMEKAAGGIIISASHNPFQWNALKLLNENGEFISANDGESILNIAKEQSFEFAEVQKTGIITKNDSFLKKHIEAILDLSLVDTKAIEAADFKIILDGINSSGGIAVPMLLEALGVRTVKKINCEPTGQFAHNPEPLPENITTISSELKKGEFDLGIVVDPDVDRLAFLCEDGEPFGEEYTLVAVADYILKNKKGPTVSNLSSSKALMDLTEKHGQTYYPSAVGEVNVVAKMKEVNAVIGGEGNGGIIYPDLHYGRDALVGIALFLSHLAQINKPVSGVRSSYPQYVISKNKIELTPEIDLDNILNQLSGKYTKNQQIDIDGLKIFFENDWVHLRKSNTEPIIRIYAESDAAPKAGRLAQKIMEDIRDLIKVN